MCAKRPTKLSDFQVKFVILMLKCSLSPYHPYPISFICLFLSPHFLLPHPICFPFSPFLFPVTSSPPSFPSSFPFLSSLSRSLPFPFFPSFSFPLLYLSFSLSPPLFSLFPLFSSFSSLPLSFPFPFSPLTSKMFPFFFSGWASRPLRPLRPPLATLLRLSPKGPKVL